MNRYTPFRIPVACDRAAAAAITDAGSRVCRPFWLQAARLLLTLWIASTCHCELFAQSQSSSILGAVLLKNDRVVVGQVEPRGELFVVHIADKSNISLPKDQVQYVGLTVEDLYFYKLRAIANWSVGDHFKLTRWCMANNLLDKAADHYQQVAKQAGSHPRVKQLAVELKNQMLEVPEFRDYLGLAPMSQSADTQTTASSDGSDAARSRVVTASGSSQAAQHPQVVTRFSERIQPILINRCSQAACHGGQSTNSLRVIEPYAKAYAQTTTNNLNSVLAQISRDSDADSRLIAYATTAHGLQRQPGIAVTETSLVSELKTWVHLVLNPVVSAEGSASLSTAMSTQPASAPNPSVPPQFKNGLFPVKAGAVSLKTVPRAEDGSQVLPTGFPAGESAPTMAELNALDTQLDQLLGPGSFQANPPLKNSASPAAKSAADQAAGTSAGRASSDPFDPAEFNRRSRVTPVQQ